MKLQTHHKSTKLIIIKYIDQYFPKSRYESQDDFSKNIIELKNKNNNYIDIFFHLLKGKIKKNPKTVICVVPSSKIAKRESGIRELAFKLKNYCQLTTGLQILHRGKDIPSKHERKSLVSYEEQYNSLYLIDINIIKDKNVLLLDDVVTSGNTLFACSNLLLENRAKQITCIVLGKTIESKKYD